MLKTLITLALIIGVYLVGKSILGEYKAKQQRESAPAAPLVMEGLPPELEASLQAAQSQGAPALRDWLEKYGQHARDPRLAEIQLTYVVLVSRTDPAEAKRLFQAVKRRTPKSSPVYEKIQRLDSTYGN